MDFWDAFVGLSEGLRLLSVEFIAFRGTKVRMPRFGSTIWNHHFPKQVSVKCIPLRVLPILGRHGNLEYLDLVRLSPCLVDEEGTALVTQGATEGAVGMS